MPPAGIISMSRQRGNIIGIKTQITNGMSTHAIDYIELPISRLGMSRMQTDIIVNKTRKIIEIVEKENISKENMPHSLAAGCISYAIKHTEGLVDIPFSKIATVTEISIATLMKCIKRIEMKKEIIDSFLNQ